MLSEKAFYKFVDTSGDHTFFSAQVSERSPVWYLNNVHGWISCSVVAVIILAVVTTGDGGIRIGGLGLVTLDINSY